MSSRAGGVSTSIILVCLVGLVCCEDEPEDRLLQANRRRMRDEARTHWWLNREAPDNPDPMDSILAESHMVLILGKDDDHWGDSHMVPRA